MVEVKLIDLSQEIKDKGLVHPIHPRPMIFQYATHEESGIELGTGFSYASLLCQFSDHVGTHADAFVHFDPESSVTIEQMDLHFFYGEAICIDVSFVPERTYITVEDLQVALENANLEIRQGDILLLYTGMYDKYPDKPEYLSQQAGLNEESSVWLFKQGIKLLGIDAVSTDTPADQSYPNHRMCAKYKITHIENMANLDQVVGKRFIFAGFPIKIKGGTGAPLRAVAMLNE